MTHAKTPLKATSLTIDQAFQQAVAYHQAGHIHDAKHLYRTILQTRPNHLDARRNLDLLTEQNSKKSNIRKNHLKLNKNFSSHKQKTPTSKQIDTLVDLFNTEQYAEALTLSRQMTEHFPHYDFGWKTLGTVLKQIGRDAEALQPLEKAVELSSDDAETLNNLSVTYKVLGQIDKAEVCCRQALKIKPDLAEAHNTLGIILHELGRFSEAETCHRHAIQLKPDFISAYNNLGTTLKDLGQFSEAEASCLHALKINQKSASTYLTLGTIYHDLGQFKKAEASYRQALEFAPNYAITHYNLGNTFKEQDLLDKAEASFRQALIIDPDFTLAHNNLGNTLKELCLHDEAEACYRKSLQLQPSFDTAFSNLLFILNYHPDKTAQEIFETYQEYDEKYCLPHQKEWQPHNNNRSVQRRLKVGYVSSDFRKHSAQYFLEPLMAHHDKQSVEVYAYAELAVEDSVTTRYKIYADHWIPTRGMSNEALAQRIRADGIDILVDLAGHTAKNRLVVFARKPAPVSVSWLGYGYTTGLTAIDYFLTDITTVPQDSEALFSETPYRITTPSFCYRPADGMGEINDLPALTNGHITFGTLTRTVRLNHRTITAWSEILRCVPDSKLVIDCKAFSDKYMQDLFAEKFVAHGIARERLEFGYHTPPWDVLRGIDIGLDCFPHNSGTTLFETLYMGVPYITLSGRPSVGRLGSCILQGLGRPEWIADNEADYVAKAVELASDTSRLSEIRAELRDQMENSPLRDEKNFAVKVETAYRNIWKKWCQKNDEQSDQASTSIIDQALQQAITYHQTGQLSDAERLYRMILKIQPNHSDAQHNLTLLADQIKQVTADLPDFKAALEADPSQAEHWQSYAEALLISGQAVEALMVIKTAMQCGLDTEAIQILRKRAEHAIQDQPATDSLETSETTKQAVDTPPNKLSKAKNRKSVQKQKAVTSPTTTNQQLPQTEIDQLVTLYNAGNHTELEIKARLLIDQYPNAGFAWKVLGASLQIQNKEALPALRKATELLPDDAQAHSNLGVLLEKLGHFKESAESCRRALQINPDSAAAYCNLGNALLGSKQISDAVESYRQALKIKPEFANAHNNLGIAQKNLGQFDEAIESYRRALAIQPDYAEAHNNLGSALKSLGQFTEAEASIRRALEINPDEATAYNNLLFLLNYHPDLSAEEIYQAYQDYNTKHCIPLHATWRAHNNDRNPDRRLRIGYVSPDFWHHSCRLFLEPLLAHHDKTQVEIYAYAELAREDEVTARYKSYVEHWIPTRGMKDEVLAERIRYDGIDILVELAGHTAGNRLLTFARKPAPVSLTWLGYGYTTGVRAIDYYLTDETCAPKGSEGLFAEQPWRINTPAFAYRPNPDMGKVSNLPALQRGHITFGTLTRSVRINHHTIRVWSTLLKTVPNARLVIDSADFKYPAMQERMAASFAEHGITRERLEIGYHTPPWDVLRGIDIGLDCFPHNSGATLFESLYMGVPYITLAGRPSVGRLGSCILQGLGRPEWIADNEADYVAKAVELASDTSRLSEIRAELRDQMENSPLRDEKNFAVKVETAYRNIWKKWCQKNDEQSDQASTLIIDQALQQAITCHQTGQLSDAERLYRMILKIQPDHSDAQHNLTLLADQIKQVTADLPDFKAALEADPSQAEHWQSYAEALLISGQAVEALMVIKTAMQCGLDTEAIQILRKRAEHAIQDQPATDSLETSETTKQAVDTPPNKLSKAKNRKSVQKQKAVTSPTTTNQQLPQTEIDQLVTLYNAGNHTELEIKARLLIDQYPNAGFAWKVLGASLQIQNKEALPALRKATELLPDDAQAHSNLGVLLEKLGHFKESAESCRRALQINPDSAAAYCNLGNALLGSKQISDAVESYRQALKIKPDYIDARNNLANALTRLGQLDNAVKNCRQALEINPDYAEAHNNLGIAQKNLGQLDDAAKSYRRALKTNPDYAEAHNNLGNVLQELGQLDEAVASIQHAITIKPQYAEAHNNLGNVLRELGQLDEATASIQHALTIRPQYAEAHTNLGNTLQSLGQLTEAEASIRRALEINPDEATAYNNLLFLLNYHPDLSAEEIYQAYQDYNTKRCIPLHATWRAHNNDRNPGRRLRIGYVSPDFRRHSCQLFLEPLLAHHDKTQVEIYAYAELAREDEVTARYKSYVEHWIPTRGMKDEVLAERIRYDGIDILVELAGHTAGNRLLTFARKPAPVSLTWLGYGYTTGVRAIDYYLTDETCAPKGSEGLFAEQPWRINTPAFAYRPNPDMGKVSNLPALQRGHITFGTLTRSVRINHHTIRVWSTLLKTVPNARLVIDSADFKYPAMQERMAASFAEHGITRERLEIGYHTPPWDVLRGIDIGLDCFPHNSGATLFESLYMGVPYITLSGRPSVGRLGSCILQGLGRSEWIADSEADYVAKAVELASDTSRLSEIRAGLRDQMENSPLKDEKNFAVKVETAYREIWKEWCLKNNLQGNKP